jgi:toxin-antitoxin system PIN domain toxin
VLEQAEGLRTGCKQGFARTPQGVRGRARRRRSHIPALRGKSREAQCETAATEPIGFARSALLAFIRICTRRGLLARPLGIGDAFRLVEAWLSAHNAVVVHPGEDHAEILRGLLEPLGTAENLTGDAHLAALAIDHGAKLVSLNRDFNRFGGLRPSMLKA